MPSCNWAGPYDPSQQLHLCPKWSPLLYLAGTTFSHCHAIGQTASERRLRKLPEFTGISAPYEPPEDSELVIQTGKELATDSIAILLAYVISHIPLHKVVKHPIKIPDTLERK